MSGTGVSLMESYVPIALFLLLGLLMGSAMLGVGLLLGRVLGHARPDAEKQSAYECGFEPIGGAREPFDVRYYLVAILFILFDLEIVFFLPWAIALRDVGVTAFWAMMLFLALLVVGFFYEWRKGALTWQ